MKWLRGLLIILGLLVTVLVALPFVIKLDDYIPKIEQIASDKLKQKIAISKIDFSAFPAPRIALDGIVIGENKEISLGKVTITPDVMSLLSSTRVIRSVEVDAMTLTHDAIGILGALAKPADQSAGPAPVRVEKIKLTNSSVDLGTAAFGPFDADVDLNRQGAPQEVKVVTKDGKLTVNVKPDKGNYLVDVAAKSWQPPIGPPVVFDELSIKGVATVSDANLSDITAKLYGGIVRGAATAGWQKGMQVKGNLDISGVELKQLVPLLSAGLKVSGRLNAKPVFSGSAASVDQLVKVLHLETQFSVQNGVLYGIDIEKAAMRIIKKDESGGETRFDQLSGHLVMDKGAFKLSQLDIASGVMAAKGDLDISADKALSGKVNAQIKIAGVGATVPLSVAGTVARPLAYPTGATIAGMAVGTAVLGPALGTSVGAKVGDWASSLLGGKKSK